MDQFFQHVALLLVLATAVTESCATAKQPAGAQLDAPVGAIHTPPPAYPADALEAGHEGRVVLLVKVGPDGLAQDVSLHKFSGSETMDDAALQAVKNWKFTIPKVNGIPVSTEVRVPIDFKINRPAALAKPAEMPAPVERPDPDAFTGEVARLNPRPDPAGNGWLRGNRNKGHWPSSGNVVLAPLPEPQKEPRPDSLSERLPATDPD